MQRTNGGCAPVWADCLAIGRRTLLQGAALAAGAHAARAAPEAFTDGAAMLVAGPQGGYLDQWAGILASPLARGLPPGTPLRRQAAGGPDGVTAANQFEARVSPDGQTVLLLPGDAAVAWLAGDPRARFDAAQWVPVLSGLTSAVLVSRVPAAALRPGVRLRVAASGPAGPDLAALLGLELLGVEAVPLFEIHDAETAQQALAAHAVDAVLLRGERVPQRAAAMGAQGIAPVFALGLPDDSGEIRRDRQLADIPVLGELVRERSDAVSNQALARAWRATAAAAQLDFGLVLPQLAPAALVSLWRRAAAGAASAPELMAASAAGLRTVAAPAPALPSIAADASALLELRRWLAARYNWRPA